MSAQIDAALDSAMVAEALSPKLEGWQINAGYTINENDSNLSIYKIDTNLWKLTVTREFIL